MAEGAKQKTVVEGSPVHRIVVLTITALVTGLTVSFAAIAFVECVGWLNNALLVSPRARVQYESMPWLVTAATIGVPTLGGLIVGVLLTRFCSEKRPLTPPDVVRAVQFHQPLPPVRDGVVSTGAAAISLGFGASVGQYGPMVYLGALVGSLAGRLQLGVRNLPAIAIACGVAAAISTAFNAPIAGLVFAHEVVLRHYATQAFAPTTVASATGYVVANVVFERPALFLVDFEGVNYGHEFLLFGLLGVLAAGVAVSFMMLVLKSTAVAARLPGPAAIRPAIAGLVLGTTALWLPDVLGVGQEALRFATIEGAFLPGELLLLVIAKIALTALCIGFGFAGGVFSPALLIGVLFGALYWTLLTMTGQIATSGVAVYAICGMMAVTSPVIGAPLTTILIVFELTRSYDLTIAAMVAVVFSNLIAHLVFGRSLYDVQLSHRGIDLSSGRDQARLQAIFVSEYAIEDYPKARLSEPAKAVADQLRGSLWSEVFITDNAGVLRGTLRSIDMAEDSAEPIAGCVIPPQVVFYETTTIWSAMRALPGFVGDAIPVVDEASGKLKGVVTEAALVEAYLDVVHQLRKEENAPI